MFNMNDILARLQNGEKIEDIGNEIAGMMNQAMAQYQAEEEAARAAELAKQAEVEKAQAKRELIEEMVEIIQELAILDGMDPADMQISEEELDQLVDAFTEMFAAMRDLKKMFADIEAKLASDEVPASLHSAPSVKVHVPKSDEQILADFIKMFN